MREAGGCRLSDKTVMIGAHKVAVYAIVAIAAIAFAYYLLPYLIGKCQRAHLAKIARGNRAIALSFDDGPGNILTPAILDLLARNNAKATFFLLGRNIGGREEIVKRMAEQGHEICSHGFDHLNHWKVSPIRAIKDIRRGWEAIDAALETTKGIYPFRPPYGKLNFLSLAYLWIRRAPVVYWSLDSRDTRSVLPSTSQVVAAAREAGGAVLLAHDFDRDEKGVGELVHEFVRALITMARESDMKVLAVTELLNQKRQDLARSRCKPPEHSP
ncbi:MAG: polysaccharide deacetylase family protein [Phycisphaerales bacterium]|nr:MAG: polysaccharide deacetylase family protein [Phycisphaerales bacterium]